jgi:CDGSH iron-sulfur domain-containing protein 3
MPRDVRHTAMLPHKIDPATWPRDAAGNLKPIFVCACGLSKNFPLCDGTHKACAAEQPGTVYRYDASGQVIAQSPEE